ncbi:MAG TPA: CrcB family protein [Longimicrobiales bacterium]|nr:CrcB family protein [Longimicrobiales bacterium]
MIAVWAGLGGALGALARFVMGAWVTTWAGAGFPWATFLMNASGSLLLGCLARLFTGIGGRARTRAFTTVGLCGGFTTFSTFDLETYALLQHGRYELAAAYSSGSVVTCIAAIAAGFWLGSVLVGVRARTRPA